MTEIIDDLLGLLVAEAAAIGERGAHRLAHEGDAVAPAVLVARDRRHPGLEAVAAHAVLEQGLFALLVGQELIALQLGNLGPAHHGGLQGEIGRGVLIGRELDAGFRVGLVADRAHLQAVVAGRQVLGNEAALIVGQDADRHLQAGVARLHERAPEGSAVRPGHRAGNGRGIGAGRSEDHQSKHSQGS
jgi:hypothetical protein